MADVTPKELAEFFHGTQLHCLHIRDNRWCEQWAKALLDKFTMQVRDG